MTSAQVAETSVNVTNSSSRDYTHPDGHNLLTYDMTPGIKPFAVNFNNCSLERTLRNILKKCRVLLLWK